VFGEGQMVAPAFVGEESPDTTGQGAPLQEALRSDRKYNRE